MVAVNRTRPLLFGVGTFAATGLAFGLFGLLSMQWAQTQFITAARGETIETFGPVLLAVVYFQTAVMFFLVGPVLAGLTGALIGSRFPSPSKAALAGGGSSFAGFLVFLVLSLGITSQVSGPGTGQLFTLGAALVPALVATVLTSLAGGGGGALGSMAVR